MEDREEKSGESGESGGRRERERMEMSVGDQARVDQDMAEFRELTERLVRLHLQVSQELEHEDGVIVRNERMRTLQTDMTRMMRDELFLVSEPERVFKYLVFLIDLLAHHRVNVVSMAEVINHLGAGLNFLAESLGMKQVLGGSVDVGEDEDEPDYVTGTGQRLHNVHPASKCEGWCVIHNPIPGPWENWPTHWRGSEPFDIWTGFERICPHGVGHTAVEERLRGNLAVHGCCPGCACGPNHPGVVEILGDQDELLGYRLKDRHGPDASR